MYKEDDVNINSMFDIQKVVMKSFKTLIHK